MTDARREQSPHLVRETYVGVEQRWKLARLDRWPDESNTREAPMSALPACMSDAHRMKQVSLMLLVFFCKDGFRQNDTPAV